MRGVAQGDRAVGRALGRTAGDSQLMWLYPDNEDWVPGVVAGSWCHGDRCADGSMDTIWQTVYGQMPAKALR